MILRRLARPMLAAVFIAGGIDTLRNPGPRVKSATPLLEKAAEVVPLPASADTLVKVNAAVHVAAGSLLAVGKFPRLSALALAGSVAPTTVAGHPFWDHEDPQLRAAQRTHFLKNIGLLGGLLLASADTEAKPSMGWRARRAARKAAKRVESARERLPG
ncbi:MAG: DoxX family protein [Sciscionella sp.]